MRLCGALVLPPSVRSFEIPYVSLCHETVRHGSGGRDRGHSRPGASNQAGAKELTQDLLYRPPIERKLSDEPSSNRLDTILADRNSDCYQPHDFALPWPMPLVGFRGALRVGDRRAARWRRLARRGAGRPSWLRYCNVTFSLGRISQWADRMAARLGPDSGRPARRRSTAFRDGWTASRRRASRNPAAPRNAVSMGGGRPAERRFTMGG